MLPPLLLFSNDFLLPQCLEDQGAWLTVLLKTGIAQSSLERLFNPRTEEIGRSKASQTHFLKVVVSVSGAVPLVHGTKLSTSIHAAKVISVF